MGFIKKIKKKKDEISFCHDLNLIVSEIISFKSGSTIMVRQQRHL